MPRGRSQTISYPVKPPQHYRNATHDLHSPFRPGSSSLSEPRTAYLNSRAYKVRSEVWLGELKNLKKALFGLHVPQNSDVTFLLPWFQSHDVQQAGPAHLAPYRSAADVKTSSRHSSEMSSASVMPRGELPPQPVFKPASTGQGSISAGIPRSVTLL